MSGTQRIRCVLIKWGAVMLIKWGTVMWNGHKVLVQGSRQVNLMYAYCVILSYVPWCKCVWTLVLCEYVSNMRQSGICCRGWLICEWYWLTGCQCDMYITENRMICAWLNVICYTLWIIRECHVLHLLKCVIWLLNGWYLHDWLSYV